MTIPAAPLSGRFIVEAVSNDRALNTAILNAGFEKLGIANGKEYSISKSGFDKRLFAARLAYAAGPSPRSIREGLSSIWFTA